MKIKYLAILIFSLCCLSINADLGQAENDNETNKNGVIEKLLSNKINAKIKTTLGPVPVWDILIRVLSMITPTENVTYIKWNEGSNPHFLVEVDIKTDDTIKQVLETLFANSGHSYKIKSGYISVYNIKQMAAGDSQNEASEFMFAWKKNISDVNDKNFSDIIKEISGADVFIGKSSEQYNCMKNEILNSSLPPRKFKDTMSFLNAKCKTPQATTQDISLANKNHNSEGISKTDKPSEKTASSVQDPKTVIENIGFKINVKDEDFHCKLLNMDNEKASCLEGGTNTLFKREDLKKVTVYQDKKTFVIDVNQTNYDKLSDTVNKLSDHKKQALDQMRGIVAQREKDKARNEEQTARLQKKENEKICRQCASECAVNKHQLDQSCYNDCATRYGLLMTCIGLQMNVYTQKQN